MVKRFTVKGWDNDHIEMEDSDGEWVRYDDHKVWVERAEAALTEALKVLEVTRSLVCEAAMVGFNYNDGDWATRLYVNNGKISAVLKGSNNGISS